MAAHATAIVAGGKLVFTPPPPSLCLGCGRPIVYAGGRDVVVLTVVPMHGKNYRYSPPADPEDDSVTFTPSDRVASHHDCLLASGMPKDAWDDLIRLRLGGLEPSNLAASVAKWRSEGVPTCT